MTYAGKRCWIIGASSGIGAALAEELAQRGARLALSGRRGDALQELIVKLPASHHMAIPLDVAEPAEVSKAAEQVAESFGGIDYVIILAATYNPAAVADAKPEDVRRIIDVNLLGTFNCVHAALPLLRSQKQGVLALCGSVAGYRGLARSQPYGATKAAIINLAETLRIEEAGHGIDVRLISPGFVQTPMTDKNNFQMPMIIPASDAAKCLADGLLGRAFEICFPRKFTSIMKLLRLLPDAIYFPIARRFQ